MPLLVIRDAELAFGLHPLLDGAAMTLDDGERVGLIGRNGTGKSSLLGAIAGRLPLDDGAVQLRDGARPVLVEQEPLLPAAPTLRDSLIERGRLEEISDERERWRTLARLGEYLHRFGLDETRDPDQASGGERKRAALALAFALEPSLLMLDEPTNHLDIDGILLLEQLLLEGPACLVITHDRAFLDRVTTRIVELDRGTLRSYPGNYAAYERRKAEQLEAETLAHRRFDKFWAQEEVWIRKGIEARRTRNAGRVTRLERLREERGARRERLGNLKLQLDAGERTGKLVAELKSVAKTFGERPIARDLDLRILRGDRIGLVGPNGAGKSTLLKLILGELAPDSGTVRLGTGLQVAYFDQLRTQLDPEQTIAENVSPGSDWIEINGERRHLIGYLGDFLFAPQRIDSPVSMLSGGERNRLLLARLFARPANVMVLDEPTNDLDIESLELLESLLQGYSGTVLLVSHDRAFLDNVVTQVLAPLGDGRWKEYVGGFSDWLRQRPTMPSVPAASPAAKSEPVAARGSAPARVRLSFKETRELQQLPARIESLEAEQATLIAAMSAADYQRRGADGIRADRQRLVAIELELTTAYARWSELEAKTSAAG